MTRMDNHSVRARSFGKQASLYDRLRPDYPAKAIAAFLPETGKRVVDVGAGTGKLTSVLASIGHHVIAIEPDPVMRATLAEQLPGIDAREGTGESMPVDDHSADAITYGQSWHWVEAEAAGREARRVLAEDGVLAMLWNVPDPRIAWVKELLAITHPGQNAVRDMAPMAVTGFASGVMTHTTWQQSLTRDELVDLVSTFSRISTSPDAERAALLDAVREVVATHPDLRDVTEFELPYVCISFHYLPS